MAFFGEKMAFSVKKWHFLVKKWHFQRKSPFFGETISLRRRFLFLISENISENMNFSGPFSESNMNFSGPPKRAFFQAGRIKINKKHDALEKIFPKKRHFLLKLPFFH